MACDPLACTALVSAERNAQQAQAFCKRLDARSPDTASALMTLLKKSVANASAVDLGEERFAAGPARAASDEEHEEGNEDEDAEADDGGDD